MKDRLASEHAGSKDEKSLDLAGRDRVHVMFAGTTLVTAKQGEAASSNEGVPPTPDGGCLCYVLRSGFLSAQGELMMMIEFSQQKGGPSPPLEVRPLATRHRRSNRSQDLHATRAAELPCSISLVRSQSLTTRRTP